MKLYKYGAIIVIGILLVSTILYIALDNSHSSGITAMEGRAVAEIIAKAWHNDALLSQIGGIDNENQVGNTNGWVFTYYSPSTEQVEDNMTKYERAHIVVYANNTTVCSYAIRYSGEIGQSIDNWTIDSPDAYQIVENNSQISSFLDKYRNSDVEYTLQIRNSYPDRPVWFIIFLDMGIMDNPHSAEIHIDANTGEVLYVRADD